MYGQMVVSGSAQSSTTATAAGGTGAKSFTIYVSRFGFNWTSGKLDSNVQQGNSVSIKFVWNDTDLTADSPHQLEVQGYGAVSAAIGQLNPVSVVQSTADKTGTSQINRIIPCVGMANLQNGWLVVAAAGSGCSLSPGPLPQPREGARQGVGHQGVVHHGDHVWGEDEAALGGLGVREPHEGGGRRPLLSAPKSWGIVAVAEGRVYQDPAGRLRALASPSVEPDSELHALTT